MKSATTYLNFDGNCSEVMNFYASCFGVEVQMTPFSEVPGQPAGIAKGRIMHAQLLKGSDALLMASDTMPGSPLLHPGDNFSIAVQCESPVEIEKLFAALGENGKITMPLQDTFWGARFGMLTDKFGIQWMFNLDLPKE